MKQEKWWENYMMEPEALLFTPNQVGQQLMFASGLPLKNFIDVSGGYYQHRMKP
jgi:hypothetical protein